MKRVLIVIATLLVIHCAKAQNYLKSKEDISKHSDRVVMFLKDEEFQKAFDELRNYWQLPENELDQLESQTTKQFNMVSDRFGKIIGADFIKDKTIKDIIIRKIYVIRFERHFIKVLITYYKNDTGWILNGFKFDDQLDELYD